MKKWFLLATAILTFSGVSGAALYQHQANAGTDTKTVTVTTPKKQLAATVKPKKENATASSTVAVTNSSAATTQPSEEISSSSTVATVHTETASTASTTQATPSVSAEDVSNTAPVYLGTWQNEHVTLTITADQLTVVQAGVTTKTGYKVTPEGNGFVLIPTDVGADAIYLVPVSGGLEWVAPGVASPLILHHA